MFGNLPEITQPRSNISSTCDRPTTEMQLVLDKLSKLLGASHMQSGWRAITLVAETEKKACRCLLERILSLQPTPYLHVQKARHVCVSPLLSPQETVW